MKRKENGSISGRSDNGDQSGRNRRTNNYEDSHVGTTSRNNSATTRTAPPPAASTAPRATTSAELASAPSSRRNNETTSSRGSVASTTSTTTTTTATTGARRPPSSSTTGSSPREGASSTTTSAWARSTTSRGLSLAATAATATSPSSQGSGSSGSGTAVVASASSNTPRARRVAPTVSAAPVRISAPKGGGTPLPSPRAAAAAAGSTSASRSNRPPPITTNAPTPSPTNLRSSTRSNSNSGSFNGALVKIPNDGGGGGGDGGGRLSPHKKSSASPRKPPVPRLAKSAPKPQPLMNDNDPGVPAAAVSPPACCFCGDACTCGDDCACSEELCQCKAYQIVNSLGGAKSAAKSSCCASQAHTNVSSLRPLRFVSETDARPIDPLAPVGKSGAAPPYRGQRAEFLVQGMTCSMCSQAIERAVAALTGVRSVDISLTADTAVVEWDGDTPTTADAIRHAIEAIGYDVPDVRALVDDPGDSKKSGADSNQQTLSDEDPVEERWQRYRQRQVAKVGQRRSAFLWAMVSTLPILTFTMILPHIVPNLFRNRRVVIPVLHHSLGLEALVLWLLATPVQFICGGEFYKMAWYGFLSGRAGMDLLVALGTTASYGYALSGAWTGDDHAAHFFETSAVLISFVLAGKWMQAAAVRRTSEALTQLMQLQSPTAVKITPQRAQQPFNPLVDPYKEEVVDIRQVLVGDTVKVIRGASIPADGRVMFGEISVDESMVTGESLPILKSKGSVVLGGTICVESGSIDGGSSSAGAAFVQVTGVGSSTALAQIVQLVQQAQTRAVPIQFFADQVSAVFVPAVCTVSVVTYLVWYALCSSNVVPEKWYRDELGEDAATFSLKFAIACLVISCPCALGLATPTAVMVGTGVGAKCGVLMKGGAALEIASKVDTVILDKTGTITKGVPAVTDFINLADPICDDRTDDRISTEEYYLWLLGSLERTSEHPLAKAIVTFAEERLGDAIEQNAFVHPTEFRAITGRGASGTIQGKISVAVGNRSFASVLGLNISRNADECMKQLEEDGKTAIVAAIDGKICFVLGIADELKPDAVSSISFLRDVMGVDVWMVTGDNARTAAAISRELRMPANRVIAEALPAAKLEKVCALQAEGQVVCMVGDGINDSAALAQADVGIGMGAGAEIATEAADMILVRGHVADVCTALHLSRAMFRRIQINLALSLVYNSLGIPIAAGVFYPFVHSRLPPTLAAIAMALSSVSVVISSLTLRFYQPPDVMERINRRVGTSITVWDRTLSRRNSLADDNDILANLLSDDHLTVSELTERIDNRTAGRMEEC